MPYKIDFFDHEVVEWSLTEDGAEAEQIPDYTPTFYVGLGEGDGDSLSDARSALEKFPTVVQTMYEEWRPGFRHDAEEVLRVDLMSVAEVSRMARWIHEWGDPGEYRCFNVDFSREFRYCLENGLDPTPSRELRTFSIEGLPHEFTETELPLLRVGDETISRSLEVGLPEIEDRIDRVDPAKLVIEQQTSKTADEYAHTTRTVAALERAVDDGRGIQPGQGVSYVVVGDSKRSRERVQLADEADGYDVEFYVGEMLRATESVLSPLGWRQEDSKEYLTERTDASITAFGGSCSES